MKKGGKMTQEQKAKIGAANRGKHPSLETRAKMSNSHRGVKLSQETRAKMSKALKGRNVSKETRAKIGVAHKGKIITPLMRAIMSTAAKNRIRYPLTLKTRAKISAAAKGRKNSKETIAKITGGNNPNWKGGGEASRARAEEKRRGFGFIPLNDRFCGSEGHHLDREFVVFIPKEMHMSVRHSVLNDTNMEEINALALDFVYGD